MIGMWFSRLMQSVDIVDMAIIWTSSKCYSKHSRQTVWVLGFVENLPSIFSWYKMFEDFDFVFLNLFAEGKLHIHRCVNSGVAHVARMKSLHAFMHKSVAQKLFSIHFLGFFAMCHETYHFR